jgi:Mor family transcriptional regulator
MIARDFMRGLSVLGLARKYGRTRQQIEAILRKHL